MRFADNNQFSLSRRQQSTLLLRGGMFFSKGSTVFIIGASSSNSRHFQLISLATGLYVTLSEPLYVDRATVRQVEEMGYHLIEDAFTVTPCYDGYGEESGYDPNEPF